VLMSTRWRDYAGNIEQEDSRLLTVWCTLLWSWSGRKCRNLYLRFHRLEVGVVYGMSNHIRRSWLKQTAIDWLHMTRLAYQLLIWRQLLSPSNSQRNRITRRSRTDSRDRADSCASCAGTADIGVVTNTINDICPVVEKELVYNINIWYKVIDKS
jgi:hypothetical protein